MFDYKSEMTVKRLVPGAVFGWLTILNRDGHIWKRGAWLCRCECGKEIRASDSNLLAGRTLSCGCLQKSGPLRERQKLPLIDLIREMLDYDQDTGVITWKISPMYGDAMKGIIAGTQKPNGYIEIKLREKLYKAHRIAWAYVHGEFPLDEIDHINGDRSDNRIANLRSVPRKMNAQNISLKNNNSCGYTGVTNRSGKWEARLSVDGKSLYLGKHNSPEEAQQAYINAKLKHHPGFMVDRNNYLKDVSNV